MILVVAGVGIDNAAAVVDGELVADSGLGLGDKDIVFAVNNNVVAGLLKGLVGMLRSHVHVVQRVRREIKERNGVKYGTKRLEVVIANVG